MMTHKSRWFAYLVLGITAGTTLCLPAISFAQESLEGQEEAAMRAAVASVAPSVIRLETLGGLEKVGRQLVGTGPTTGLIVTSDGYILSSAFNFVQRPSSILATLPNGKRAAARIVARDRRRKLVLLKVDTDQKLPVAQPAPREEFTVGQWAIAVGRTYPGDFPNVSVGIVSAVNRIWSTAVQTDAKVSPSNYGGPLVDIRGRVIGILVPLSPQQQSELAGAEWYDSGIGFAVPLVDVLQHLDTLKHGTDLYPGIMGISLKGTDMYSLPATIAACPAKSPAREAGLQVGDTIVEIDGRKIERQAQLRHALGPHVAGDTIHVTVLRGEKKTRVEATVTLVEKLEPYVQPRLGILPRRDPAAADGDRAAGVHVRFVFPGSPAAESGLQEGDQIVGVGDKDVAGADALRELVAGLDPGSKISIRLRRAGKSMSVPLTLGPPMPMIPDKLPPAHGKVESSGDPRPPVGIVEVKIPEEPNKCVAYVPENYQPNTPYGLLVWLHAPGSFDQAKLIERWKTLCTENDLILLAPQARDVKRWTATETEFVRKTIDDVAADYRIDPTRIVLHGDRAGGAMAYLVTFANRDIVRGVAPVNAPVPSRVQKPATDPVQPLGIFSVASEKSKTREQIEASEEALKKLAFPLITKTLPGDERYLNEAELAELVRWIDTLDQI